MKHIYKLSLIIFAIIIVLPGICISQQRLSDFYLPFSENWQSGNFTANNWTTDSDNWAIDNQNGNEAPSAKFHRSPIQNNYSFSLTSNTFDASNMAVGHITLKFDLKLDDATATGTEFLKIKLKYNGNWITLDSISNTSSFDWTSYTFYIEEYAIGQQFQIAFEAEGENSLNIMDWFIDNIEIFRECDPPTNLSNTLYWNNTDDFGSLVEWDIPTGLLSPDENLHYGSIDNYTGIGVNDGLSFYSAIRWDNLNQFESDTIFKINYILNDNGFDNVILRAWKGEDAVIEILSDTVYPNIGVLNEYFLSTPIVIEPDTEYWFGCEIINNELNKYPASCNAGPAVKGYGDKINLLNGNGWQNLSDSGIEYNWNISIDIRNYNDLDSETLLGFNIYRSSNVDTAFQYIDFTNSIDSLIHYEYYDNYTPEEDTNTYSWTICFKVNAVWALENDTCVSNFATQLGAPWNDESCIMILGDKPFSEAKMDIYPNPTSSKLIIETDIPISQISIYNTTGQVVKSKTDIFKMREVLNVSDLKSGIYFIKVQTDKSTITRKFIKQ